MGPWASVIVAIAGLLAVFVMVMGFRGLMEAVEHFPGRCAHCGRAPLFPLPLQTHLCWRCHHAQGFLAHRVAGRRPRHQ